MDDPCLNEEQNEPVPAASNTGAPVNRMAPYTEQDQAQHDVTSTMPSYHRPMRPAPMTNAQQTASSGLLGEVTRSGVNNAQAHDTYLRFSQSALEGMGRALSVQARLLQLMGTTYALPEPGRIEQAPPASPSTGQQVPEQAQTSPQPVAYPREMCMEFAIGSVARVLGPEFAEVDQYPVRVRLPDEPLMLVDRIVSVEGEKASLTSGCVVTEHDVYNGRWYLDNGRCPTAITVEAGQADLFLCAYLGIDLAVKGSRAYRLLDAEVQFHRGLPQVGEVIRYEIHIDRFVKQGEVYLFFFRFEGTINGQPVLTMRNGCAGFFTRKEIQDSGGIILSADDKKALPGRRPDDWSELVPMNNEAYDRQQVEALEHGDLVGCFGQLFAGMNLQEPMRLPGGKLRLVHRVTEIDPSGGRYSLGRIKAQADIHPDDWFLTCHFTDDKVMPGTLMYECCLHTMRIYLMRMGWVGEQSEVHCEPVREVWSKLRCRGPVTTETKVVTYEVQIKEFGYHPEPYALADAFMYADERMVVQITDMSVKLSGLSKEKIEALWRNRKPDNAANELPRVAADRSQTVQPIGEDWPTAEPKPPVYTREQILAFAIGHPSEAFGEPYKVFDEQRRIARLPGPPFMFLDRMTRIEAEPWKLETKGWVEGQYDVPPDAWYFKANRQASMPFAVLLEIALQPCGWLAAYMGSALQSEEDLRFRNLGGTATLYKEVFADAGTLTTRVRTTGVSKAGGMIIEEFDTQIWQGGEIVYDCQTVFGFFSKQALANQVGVRDAAGRMFNPAPEQQASALHFELEDVPPVHPDDENVQPAIGAAMPGSAWRMIDRVDMFLPDGGPHGRGFIRGSMRVDPEKWFFKAHFYQDPVVPGSLGLESFLQLLKIAARHHWPKQITSTHRFQPVTTGAKHTWKYRGQVIPDNKNVEVDAVIKEITDQPTPTIRADGFLRVDGVPIYEMQDFALSLVPDSRNPD
jgi:3-hydroxymyristoyl/3-hydroxydecanoyl-(acyl carrier protein) dehydratase